MKGLRWKKTMRSPGCQAWAGPVNLTVDWDADAGWTYTVEWGVWTLQEYGDYEQSFGTMKAAKTAAETWLRAQAQRMLRDLDGKGK